MPKFYRIAVEKTYRLTREFTVAVPDGVKDDKVEDFLFKHLPHQYDDDVVSPQNYDDADSDWDVEIASVEEEEGMEMGDEEMDLTDEEV